MASFYSKFWRKDRPSLSLPYCGQRVPFSALRRIVSQEDPRSHMEIPNNKSIGKRCSSDFKAEKRDSEKYPSIPNKGS
jgi:hypothetical protein